MTDHELFAAYREDVYRYCRYMLRNADDAEDLCQETFLRAFRVDRTAIAQPKSWLLRIAANLCKNHLARTRLGALKAIALQYLQPSSRGETTEETAVRKEREDELIGILQQLPVKIRTVMAMHYVNELKLAEIAETLEIPLGTVKSRLNKGLALIRPMLAREADASILKGEKCLE